MFRTRKKAVALVSALAAVVLIASGCSSSSDNSSGGSSTTLKVRLFGTFGYKEAGLFDQYQNLHGLKQPAQVAVSGAVRYEVVGVNPEDLT